VTTVKASVEPPTLPPSHRVKPVKTADLPGSRKIYQETKRRCRHFFTILSSLVSMLCAGWQKNKANYDYDKVATLSSKSRFGDLEFFLVAYSCLSF